MAKIHMFSIDAEINMPADIKQEYHDEGIKGTMCGYMRKTTTDPEKVTCFYCKKIMARRVNNG